MSIRTIIVPLLVGAGVAPTPVHAQGTVQTLPAAPPDKTLTAARP